MPGSKCQIVVLAGKTGHFTDIIKNKKRGGKQMNKTPKINRLFLVTVIWILLSGIFLGFIPFVRSMDATQLMLLSQLLYLMPVIGFMIINKVDPRKWMPFKPLKLSVIAMVILYAVLMIPVTSWLNLLSMLFVRNAFESSQSELTQNALWVNMIVMAVIPPICEEFTFRGLYYNGYRQRGVWCAILGSALAFGLMHMNFNQFCYAFVPGIALGILLEATGSIFATMTAHFVVNGWSTALMAVSKLLYGTSAGSSSASSGALTTQDMIGVINVYSVIAAICIFAAIGVLICIAKHCGLYEHLKWCFKRREKRPGEPKTMFTPAFAVATVIVVIYMILRG